MTIGNEEWSAQFRAKLARWRADPDRLKQAVERMVKNDRDFPPSAGPRVRCNACGDIIQSMHRHDFKWCSCETIAVDGGSSYLKMCFKNSPEDFTVLKEEDEPDATGS